ncbi:uncharacterized protein (TIGR02687 family) [Algoriphagus boseongensis]|uniref:Uncharacterized protein (TIGR02687 family) n=1 Tax=Algoriphagus boseongensis TaxID=1442587 RepID=A0A4R6T350_9BACT|nr:BREX-1 system phosphatase PglZ type A [Algoriphagus boseongensis]TDQ15198.1 uncharacterized protein (TIGR02687 family) [Algoriphagus boseongensis]
MGKIEEGLNRLFDDHRVIFWYDEKAELKDDFENLQLNGVEKIRVEHNPFEIKYLLNKTQPESKFLLYFDYPKPSPEENWLLDMELAYHVFQTDQAALFIQEMELGFHFRDLVVQHLDFFKSKERRSNLKELATKDDGHQEVRYKMLSILFGVDNLSLSTFILAHISAYAEDNDRLDRDLERFQLEEFYWKEIARIYGFQSKSKSIFEFILEVFQQNYVFGKNLGITKESKLLLSQWRDSILFRTCYDVISAKVAEAMDISKILETSPLDKIIEDELFRLTDQKIIHECQTLLMERGISSERIFQIIKKRENKFWYADFEPLYQAIWRGAELIELVQKYGRKSYVAFEEGVKDYTENLFEVDKTYRKFIWHYRESKQNRILADLYGRIEKVYSNDWLLEYNNNWQRVIDALDNWPTQKKFSQQQFFTTHVKPVLDKKQRLFVIISDALRYECGQELFERFQFENRYTASLDHLVSSIPSYTQLGMAALLPIKRSLLINPNSDTVWVDDMVSSGLNGRMKILETNSGVRATAVQAESFMAMNSATEGRTFVKNYDLIYIYHNVIDKRGDDKTSEETVFEGVEEELNYLIDLVKKIGNMNGNNILITSDHGFVYQHHTLDESEFSSPDFEGEIWKENRRFVIGRTITHDRTVKKFTGEQLSLNSDLEVLIPKSINRLRIKGAGAKFVHGGTTLQEIVTPLVKVTRKREDTNRQVEIDIIQSTDRITTNILTVSFLQQELISEQILPRTIRSALYAADGELLSDQFKFTFDFSEGTERQREVKHAFHLGAKASGKYKNQRIKLILEEPIEGTTKWKTYKEYNFSLNISFTSDFDEF